VIGDRRIIENPGGAAMGRALLARGADPTYRPDTVSQALSTTPRCTIEATAIPASRSDRGRPLSSDNPK